MRQSGEVPAVHGPGPRIARGECLWPLSDSRALPGPAPRAMGRPQYQDRVNRPIIASIGLLILAADAPERLKCAEWSGCFGRYGSLGVAIYARTSAGRLAPTRVISDRLRALA